MKIASSSVLMESSHTAQQTWERQESLRAWVSNRRPSLTESTAPTRQQAASDVPTSNTSLAATPSPETSAIKQGMEAANNDPILQMIRAMIAMLTGEEVKVFDAGPLSSGEASADITSTDVASTEVTLVDVTSNEVISNDDTPSETVQATPAAEPRRSVTTRPAQARFGAEYERRESYTETEQTRFSANGVVRTADGKEIQFSLALEMTRSYHEESSTSIRFGDARQTRDPLVINFGGTSAQLTSQRFKFDLNADGKTESINFATQGSGFLALDRNGDGKINDGSELFGTQSGNGFADLALLDADHNGWIDENDPAYEQLRIWTKNTSGNDLLSTLKQANVGALGLAQTNTPFSLKDGNNDLLGQVRASGIFLSETGQVGSLQQIDLTV